MDEKPICADCRLPLEPGKTLLRYMGFDVSISLLRCPKCGLVYISEEDVRGRMAEAERELEGK
jgi:RNase P subunit RPR2